MWIDRFCGGAAAAADGAAGSGGARCRHARVVEYGIGAGNLAVYLFKDYALQYYAGVDVSERQ